MCNYNVPEFVPWEVSELLVVTLIISHLSRRRHLAINQATGFHIYKINHWYSTCIFK